MTTEPESFLENHKRTIFLIALFLVIFISVRLVIHPVNTTDYTSHVTGLKALWNGQNPYIVSPNYYMPPWSLVFLSPLADQPPETWLALAVAIFVTEIMDLGGPAGLLLLLHPVFYTLISSSNPEWLLVGPGLWLLHRAPRGWGRGLAWLLLACKPQTTLFLLLFDGWTALRQRDWCAFGLAGITAGGTLLLFPQVFSRLLRPFDWSATVLSNYGLVGALVATAVILALRWTRRADRETLGLLLAPIWSIYMLEYSYTATLFTLRRAGWLRTALFVAGGIGLAYLFWQGFHVSEPIGTLGMVVLAALLAPNNTRPVAAPENDAQTPAQSAAPG
ncbi:MAG TPA: hypothetical protein VMT24_11510 [Aggregatilineaceae bacterium]|nr:hypothetical protein [Aggregatilineaceae bacterium]